MNYILNLKTKKNVKLNFDFLFNIFQKSLLAEARLSQLRQKSLKDYVIYRNLTKLNSTSREKYRIIQMKANHAIAPCQASADNEQQRETQTKPNLKII